MGVKKSAVCRSRPPPNGMNPASSRVSKLLTKPSTGPGASPLSTCSRSPGANLEAQPAFVEYLVSLMRVRSSIAAEYTPAPLCVLMAGGEAPSTGTRSWLHYVHSTYAAWQTSWLATSFTVESADWTSAKVHVMLGLRVLANPDDFMEMSSIFGHNPLCETESVLGAGSSTSHL
jgi:hypothetical protein